MIDYKPDWDSIPKEFKYCYYYQDPMTDPEAQEILTRNRIPYLDARNMKRVDRPPELVDGAWYAVTAGGEKRIGQYVCTNNKINLGGSYWVLTTEITIHNRIPDELWRSDDA